MYKYYVLIIGIGLYILSSCENFVEIDTPNYQIVSEDVFKDDETANATLQGIYNQLRVAFFTGAASINVGMSGNLMHPRISHESYDAFYQHEISIIEGNKSATDNLRIWSSAYNMIYLANSLLEGSEKSSALTGDLKEQLRGKGLFIRAFAYFYLVNYYGDVPLLLTTDYRANATEIRTSQEKVWAQIEQDLDEAIDLLQNTVEYPKGERFRITQNVALALRSRVYLYREDWVNAEISSSRLIEQTGTYEILSDLDKVFLVNSREAIWQISPLGSHPTTVTAEGREFILRSSPLGTSISGYAVLSDTFLESFSNSDKRLIYWTNSVTFKEEELRFIHKYKYYSNMGENFSEASMTFRLAEQYLIRSEARNQLGKIDMAISDLDVLRQRAGIGLLSESSIDLGNEAMIDSILVERKKELFGEYGHRWLDLKRTNKIDAEFSGEPNWEDTDIWFPIPEEERRSNPNLGQNNGY